MPVTYYLMSVGAQAVTEMVARRLGVQLLNKADADFEGLGRQHCDKFVYVADNETFGETCVEIMREGARSAGTVNPRIVYLDPRTALRRFPSDRPDVVIAGYYMERMYGVDGPGLIQQMREMERGF